MTIKMLYTIIMKLTIKKYGINGEGIGYYKKKPVFVDRCLKDEEIEIDTITENNKFIRGRIKNIIKESKDRIKVECPYFDKCGSCALLHTNYDHQLEIKKEILLESLNKYAGIDYELNINESELKYHYRNSIKMPFGYKNNKLCLGFYIPGTNHFIEIDNCLMHDEILEDIRKEILRILNKYNLMPYDKKTKKGMRYLYLRILDNNVSVCIITGQDKLNDELINEIKKDKRIKNIYQSINISRNNEIFGKNIKLLKGDKYLNFKFLDYNLNISPRSFFQLNTLQAINLYHEVINNIDEVDLLVEAYAGLALMSFMANKKVKKIIAIENIKEAINNGINNAKKNNIDNIEFINGKSEDVLRDKFKKRIIDILIVDPPRSGLSDDMLRSILKTKINKIIYVSCNPATLSKNLDILLTKYKLESIKSFDMFPNCSDIESVVILERKNMKIMKKV